MYVHDFSSNQIIRLIHLVQQKARKLAKGDQSPTRQSRRAAYFLIGYKLSDILDGKRPEFTDEELSRLMRLVVLKMHIYDKGPKTDRREGNRVKYAELANGLNEMICERNESVFP